MTKKRKPNRASYLKVGGYFGLGTALGLMLLVSVARLTWHSKFYPGVVVAGIEMGGLTREEGAEKIRQELERDQWSLQLNGAGWVVPKEAVQYDVAGTLQEAYRYGRRVRVADYLLLLINKKSEFPLRVSQGKDGKWEEWINTIAPTVELTPQPASVMVVAGKVEVTNGVDGVIIDRERLWREVERGAGKRDVTTITIPTQQVKQQLSQEQLERVAERGKKLMGKTLKIELDDEHVELGAPELVTWLGTLPDEVVLNAAEIQKYVEEVAQSWDREPQDAKLEFAGGKVKEFAPGRDGIVVRQNETGTALSEELMKLLTSEEKTTKITVRVDRTPPAVTMDKVNELGIRERIGRGESYYAHSIPNRIYNVGLASARINSVLIPPGEEFSFNKYVGEVSGATGYRPAYVISAGRTVLGDGGGVCQVSTTVFRAAMAAGLPITERWGHAYRVSYYELNSKPGVDATVYAPSKDIKFKNDTPGHILIQTINDPKNLHLIIEIYGTSDGRVATIGEPKVWGVSPPPPSIYQDDPTLPTGTLKQVDWAAWGAKASFEYKVVRNGETIMEKTFATAYRPWANVYLRGTGPTN